MADTENKPQKKEEDEKKGEENQTEQKVEEPAAEPEKTMKSVVLTGYGGIKMAKVQQKPEAKPKEGEVLVRVKACGMNFQDLVIRQGALDNPPKTPFIMGFECAGEIEELGEKVEGFAVGDKIIGVVDTGAWAELVSVPTQHAFKIPPNMSFQDGAAILMNYVTAYILLFDIGNLQRNQSVLVHSVGGGVGHALCQLLRTVEGVTVFGTASSDKHESIKNNVEHIFDHSADYCQEVRKVSADGVDLVLDCLCGENTNKGISLLKPLGKYILYGSANIVSGETKSLFSRAKSWWQVDKVNPIKLFEENKTISGFNLRQLLFKQNAHDHVRDLVTKLLAMHSEGRIRPHIDSTWAFEDVGKAMQKMHDRKNVGKLLLDPSLQPKEEEPEPAAEANKETKPEKEEGATE